MRASFVIPVFLLAVTACGDEATDGGQTPDLDAADGEGCEHLQEGPGVAITATATASGAPSVDEDHRRYDTALVDVTGGKGGVVDFGASAAGLHVIFLSADVPLFINDATGAPVAIEDSATSSTACADIKGKHVVDLGVGTYHLILGPTTETEVSIVVEPLGE